MSKLFQTAVQLKVFEKKPPVTTVFRPIHYLGSKLRILDLIETTINEMDSTAGTVCDLFAGTGSVSRKLCLDRPVVSVDIQEYSRVLCSALLYPKTNEEIAKAFIDTISTSKHTENLLWAIKPLSDYESICVNKALAGEPESLCDLIEHGSIITFEIQKEELGSSDLVDAIKSTLSRLKSLSLLGNSEAISIRHFGGLYFSYKQAAQIDILRHHIDRIDNNYKDCFLAALLSTASESVNTIGKQFAQPIKPRRSDGQPKENIGTRVKKDRSLDIFDEFKIWIDKYMSLSPSNYNHQILRMDYSDALDLLPPDVKIVYADPPYTRDHYSRYYHVLETICKRDNPKISTKILNGKKKMSRGIYRNERHQSPFCIKSQAPASFENLISKTYSKQASLIISYSPFDESKKAHPRMLTLTRLHEIIKKYYTKIDIISAGLFSHTKLNHLDKHLDASDEAEILIACRF